MSTRQKRWTIIGLALAKLAVLAAGVLMARNNPEYGPAISEAVDRIFAIEF